MAELRPVHPGDIAALCTLLERSRDSFPNLTTEGFRETLRRNAARGTALCAAEGGEAVGLIIFSPPLSQISFLLVDEAYRGRGLGMALLRAALDALPGEVSLTTFREGDPRGIAARSLYRRAGFRDGELIEGYEIPMQRLILKR